MLNIIHVWFYIKKNRKAPITEKLLKDIFRKTTLRLTFHHQKIARCCLINSHQRMSTTFLSVSRLLMPPFFMNMLVANYPSDEGTDLFEEPSLPPAKQVEAKTKDAGMPRVVQVLLAAGILLKLIILVLAFTMRGKDRGEDPSNDDAADDAAVAIANASFVLFSFPSFDATTPRIQTLIQILRQHNISEDLMRDSTTPHFVALEWLAYADKSNLDLDKTPVSIILERFVVVLMYFATSGWDWDAPLHFLRSSSVCKWFDHMEDKGIVCDRNKTTVVEISIGEYSISNLAAFPFHDFQSN
jgi:hypothetical protein